MALATEADLRAGPPRISEESLGKLFAIRQQEKEIRDLNIPLWRDIASNSNLNLDDWDEDDDSGDAPPDFRQLYDNTMMESSINLANAIEGYAFGRATPFSRLTTEDPELMKVGNVKRWLQDTESRCYREKEKGGWYDESRVAVRICIDFSTMLMFRMNNIKRGLPAYQALSLNKCVFMENEFGEPDVLFRDAWLSPFDAASLLGLENLPRQVQEAYSRGQTKRWKFIQMIFPVNKFDLDIERRQTRGMPIYSVYVADIDRKSAVREGGYWTQPWWAWRFSRNANGSVWGTDSPGYLTIGASKQLQGMRQDFHRGQQQKFRPMIKASDTIQPGQIRFAPNGVTYLGAGQDFTNALTIGDSQGMLGDLMLIAKGIKSSYYADLFLTLTQNIERLKTATEVDAIKGEQAALSSAFYGRMSTEFLERSEEDQVQMAMDSGRLLPAPQELRGKLLHIDQVSPLSVMQKRYQMLDGTKQFMGEVFALAQGPYPEAADNVKINDYIQLIADTYHVDQRVVRDLVDVQRIQQVRAREKLALVKQQAENERIQAQAKAYQAGSQAPQQGSPVAQAMPQMAGVA